MSQDKIAFLPDEYVNCQHKRILSILKGYKKIYLVSELIKKEIETQGDIRSELKVLEVVFDEYDRYLNNYLIEIFLESIPYELRLLARSLKINILLTYRNIFDVLYMATLIKEQTIDIFSSDKFLIKNINLLNSKYIRGIRLSGNSEKINIGFFLQRHGLEWYIKHFVCLLKRRRKNRKKIKSALVGDFECYLYDINNSSAIDKLNFLKTKSKKNKICLISDYRILDMLDSQDDLTITFTDLFSKDFIIKYIKNYFQLKQIIHKKVFYSNIKEFSGYNISHLISLNKVIFFLTLARTEMFYYHKFIKEFMPISINTASGLHSRSYLFILASKDDGIKTNSIQHGLPFSRTGYVPTETDRMYCWGLGEEIIKSWGVKNIKFIDYLEVKKIGQYDIIDNQYILITLAPTFFTNQIISPFILHLAEEYKEEKIIVRSHPGMSHIPKDINNIVAGFDNVYWDKEFDIYKSISKSKFVLTYSSSIIEDATLQGKKIIVINSTSFIYSESISNFKNITFVTQPTEITAKQNFQ